MRSFPRLASVILLALAMPACGSCGNRTEGVTAVDAASSTGTFPPVPAPDGLLAEAWVRAPDSLWGRLQNGVSGAVGLLPADVGSLLCAAVGLDPKLAPLVDGKATAYLVAADAPGAAGGALDWAAAVPLKDAQGARSMLLGGDAGPYTARSEGGMQVLARSGKPLAAAAALSPAVGPGPQGWLVLARDEEALGRLGPYAWRTMTTRPAPDSPAAVTAQVPAPALAGPVASRMRARWGEARTWLEERDREEREQHGGRAPDFGDPAAIVSTLDAVVQTRIALVAQARGARLEADAGEGDVHVDLRLTPAAADAGADFVAAMRTGDENPLAQLPSETLLAVLSRSDATTRTDDASDAKAAIVAALGAHAGADDRRALGRAIDDLTAARGDWITGAFAWGGEHGFLLRTPSSDAGPRAVGAWIDLTRRPVLGGPLRALLQLAPPTVATASVPDITRGSLATFAAPKGPGLGVAWGMHGGELLVAAGDHAAKLLGTEVAPASRVADDPRVGAALAALGNDASFTVLAEPLRLDATRGSSRDAAAPVVFAWGRRGGDAWVHLDAADELLREVVRMQAGL